MSMDVEGLAELVADLTAAPLRAQAGAGKAVEKVAAAVEGDARRLISGVAHAPYYPASITHETRWEPGGVEAEIGPDKSRTQGALGNILEYGTSKNAPLAHLGPALDLNGPDLEQAISDLGGELL